MGKGTNKLTTKTGNHNYVSLVNTYSALATTSNTLDPPDIHKDNHNTTTAPSTKTRQHIRQRHVKHILRQLAQQESAFIDRSITAPNRKELS